MFHLVRSHSCPTFYTSSPHCEENFFSQPSPNIAATVTQALSLNSVTRNTCQEMELLNLYAYLQDCFAEGNILEEESNENEYVNAIPMLRFNSLKINEEEMLKQLQAKNTYYNKSLMGFALCYFYLNENKFAQVSLVARFFFEMRIPYAIGQFVWILLAAWMGEKKYIEVIKKAPQYLKDVEAYDPFIQLIQDELIEARHKVQFRFEELERKTNVVVLSSFNTVTSELERNIGNLSLSPITPITNERGDFLSP